MSGDGTEALAQAADRLYAETPDRFTAARDDAAKAARSDGDRDLANDLKTLRKPSIGAWLANQVMRSGDDAVDELFDLGESLRGAQDSLDGVLLRTLSRQRPHVVRALTDVANRIADDAGQKIGDQALREFEATVDAALADDGAARAVRSGRLMRPLTSTGLDAVDLDGAVAAPDALASSGAPRSRSSSAPAKTPPARKPAETSAKKARPARKQSGPTKAQRAADRKIEQARTTVTDAERAVEQRDGELADARAEVETVRARIGELEAQLAELNEQRSSAERARREADTARRGAVRDREAARRALAKAEAAR